MYIGTLVLWLALAGCGDKDDTGTLDGGAEDGGSTSDGGSTDGGSTDGGSTDGGSSDGGSTDGGSTDGGSTDGGSTDGGATDGGSTDGGAELPEPLSTCRASDGDAYTYGPTPASISDDTLTLGVTYSGGCAEHDFVLCWPDGTFMESHPVQVGLELWHDDHDDACDALVEEVLSFDLSPLAEAYEAAYGSSTGVIRVNVAGTSLTYSFF